MLEVGKALFMARWCGTRLRPPRGHLRRKVFLAEEVLNRLVESCQFLLPGPLIWTGGWVGAGGGLYIPFLRLACFMWPEAPSLLCPRQFHIRTKKGQPKETHSPFDHGTGRLGLEMWSLWC